MSESRFDLYERRLLEQLQHDGRKPMTELADAIGLSTTPATRRFDALRDNGVIAGFTARLDRRKIGLEVEVFVQVRLMTHSDQSPDHFVARVNTMPAVVACWALTGDHDFMLQALLPDVESLNRFISGELMRIPGVRDVHTNLVLRNIKGPGPLPLGHLEPPDA